MRASTFYEDTIMGSVTENLFHFQESTLFLSEPSIWRCNCGNAKYESNIYDHTNFRTIKCNCGHELTKSEFQTFVTRYRMLQKPEAIKRLGEKYDSEKPRMDLLLDFSRSFTALARLCTKGAEKYAPHSWLHVEDGEARYTAAMLRHLFVDEEYDKVEDGGIGELHDVCVAWNALTRLELKLRRLEETNANKT